MHVCVLMFLVDAATGTADYMKHSLPILMSAALLLGACSDKGTSPVAKAQYAVAEPAAPTASDLSGAPKRDYWTPVASHLAGTYRSECMQRPGTARATGTLVIAADGSYTIAGVADSLRTSERMILSHTRNPGEADGLLINAASPAAILGMMNGEQGRGSAVTFRKDQLHLSCDESTDPIGLAGKDLYTVYASVLDVSPEKIACTTVESEQQSELRYQLKDGVITINDRSFKLATMDEMVTLEKGFASMSYQANSEEEERGVTINFDTTGKIRKVITYGKDAPNVTCGT